MFFLNLHFFWDFPTRCIPIPEEFSYASQLPLKVMISSSIIIVLHTHTHTHTPACWIPFNIAPMCMYFGLTTWDWISYQGDWFSFSSHWLLITLHLGMKPREISPIHAGTSAGIVTVWVFFRQQYCWDFMAIVFLSHTEVTISQHAPPRS